MMTASNNNDLYKGALATLGFIHLAGYTAATGDAKPLIRAIRSLNQSIETTPNITTNTPASTPTSASSKTIIGIKTKTDLAKLTNSTSEFILQNDIHANNTKPIEGFSGRLDGQNHSITGLTNCLFQRLNGRIYNIRFSDAHIRIDKKENSISGIGVVACHTDFKSKLDNIHVSDSIINVNKNIMIAAGPLVGLNSGQINHAHSHNNSIHIQGVMPMAGGVVGEMIQGSLSYAIATDNKIQAEGIHSYVGGIAAVERHASFSDLHVDKTNIIARGEKSKAGGITSEIRSNVMRAYVGDTLVQVSGENSYAGGIAGLVAPQAVVTDSHLEHAKIEAMGEHSKVGGIVGLSAGTIIHSLAYNNTVIGNGVHSHIGGIIGHNANKSAELPSKHHANETEHDDNEYEYEEDYEDNITQGDNYDTYNNATDGKNPIFDDDDYYTDDYDDNDSFVQIVVRKHNQQGIINHVNSKANHIHGLGAHCKTGAIVGSNHGLVFDAKDMNNTVTGCDTITQEDEAGFGLTTLQTAAIATGVTLLANCYYNGWQQGERGLKLAARPVRTAASAVASVLCFAKKSQTAREEPRVTFSAAALDDGEESSPTTALCKEG